MANSGRGATECTPGKAPPCYLLQVARDKTLSTCLQSRKKGIETKVDRFGHAQLPSQTQHKERPGAGVCFRVFLLQSTTCLCLEKSVAVSVR